MRLALFEPDIPQNTGAILRLAACLGVGVDIIEPCGFVFTDARLKRAGMDYLDAVSITRHSSWATFTESRDAGRLSGNAGRLVLLTTKANVAYTDFVFDASDTLIVGRESAGAPQEVHEAADARIKVPMGDAMRSLNVALASAMVLGEALRQTGRFPATEV
ncbi:MAG: tRNA (cytidine(34)-2'-O)-methyltransferase [Proteobacteria bacterium]|nr:tRNA (cytidine(34)-2'-O)-methyltransferase [Pseudomonadota bacterium]